MEDRYKVEVNVQSVFVPEQSRPEQQQFVFAYTVTIQNAGDVPVQLLTRHWIITDGHGKVEEVRGDGVVGEQPHLAPGDAFRYTSGAVIETPVGSMHGSYHLRADDGTEFDAPIPAFGLAQPNRLH